MLAFLGLGTLVFGDTPKLVASNYSDRYHLSTCKIAQKIPAEELLNFASPEQAFEAGYSPCKKCRPPVPKGKENLQKYSFSSKSRKAGADDTDSSSER